MGGGKRTPGLAVIFFASAGKKGRSKTMDKERTALHRWKHRMKKRETEGTTPAPNLDGTVLTENGEACRNKRC